jgi:hypothetical protein
MSKKFPPNHQRPATDHLHAAQIAPLRYTTVTKKRSACSGTETEWERKEKETVVIPEQD